MTIVRAITVQQPWAWALIVDDPFRKDIENRTFKIATGELLIHAGQRWSIRGENDPAVEVLRRRHPHDPDYAANGLIIGSVTVLDCHEATPDCCDSPWAETSYTEHGGRERKHLYHWVTSQRAHFIKPIPAKGKLGLWKVEL